MSVRGMLTGSFPASVLNAMTRLPPEMATLLTIPSLMKSVASISARTVFPFFSRIFFALLSYTPLLTVRASCSAMVSRKPRFNFLLTSEPFSFLAPTTKYPSRVPVSSSSSLIFLE